MIYGVMISKIMHGPGLKEASPLTKGVSMELRAYQIQGIHLVPGDSPLPGLTHLANFGSLEVPAIFADLVIVMRIFITTCGGIIHNLMYGPG
jgi:hypothetical protein